MFVRLCRAEAARNRIGGRDGYKRWWDSGADQSAFALIPRDRGCRKSCAYGRSFGIGLMTRRKSRRVAKQFARQRVSRPRQLATNGHPSARPVVHPPEIFVECLARHLAGLWRR
jgi:hypothetical protein